MCTYLFWLCPSGEQARDLLGFRLFYYLTNLSEAFFAYFFNLKKQMNKVEQI
jgi:hypothetical protein